MLRTLKLDGYRGFRSYQLDGLTRVNLLVGKNNCGKTSVLEAINLLVAGGNPFVLEQSALRRGEVKFSEDSETPYKRGNAPDISHFFLGHALSPSVSFSLSSNNERVLASVDILSIEDIRDESQNTLFDDEMGSTPELGLKITNGGRDDFPVLPINADGLLLMPPYSRSRQWWHRNAPPTPALQFVAPDSLYPGSMRDMWDKVLIDGKESNVIDAMRILDPKVDSIHFLTGSTSRAFSGKAGVLVGVRGGGQRVPLGSHGDGMRRLLALSLSLVQTAKGYLLIDEVDTGLHWTAMEEMWRLIVSTARKSNVQVFATTHSYDCIRGLASLVDSYTDLASEVSIQKIDRSLERAVKLDAEKISIAVAQEIEVR